MAGRSSRQREAAIRTAGLPGRPRSRRSHGATRRCRRASSRQYERRAQAATGARASRTRTTSRSTTRTCGASSCRATRSSPSPMTSCSSSASRKDESAYGYLTVGRDDGFGAVGNAASSARPTSTTRRTCTSSSRRCARIARRASTSTPRASPSRAGEARRASRGEDRPADELAARLHEAAGGDDHADDAGAARAAKWSTRCWRSSSATRPRQSPRALRFELEPGQPVRLVLEPWEKVVRRRPARATTARRRRRSASGARRRLLVLARLLPLADSIEVGLLGDGPAELLGRADGRDDVHARPVAAGRPTTGRPARRSTCSAAAAPSLDLIDRTAAVDEDAPRLPTWRRCAATRWTSTTHSSPPRCDTWRRPGR